MSVPLLFFTLAAAYETLCERIRGKEAILADVVARLTMLTQRPAGFAGRLPAGSAAMDAVGMGALTALIVAGFCWA